MVESRALADAALCGVEQDPDACRTRVELLRTVGLQACSDSSTACTTCCGEARTAEERAACVVPAEIPLATGEFTPADPDANEDLPFPVGPNGNGFTVLDLPDGKLVIDPSDRGPVWAAAACSEAVLACLSPPNRNLSGCLVVAPPCERTDPWNDDGPLCCPTSCHDRYQALRRTGLDDPDAFASAIYDDPPCIPGLVGRPTS